MKHLLTILSGLLVALLFARCADDDSLSGGIDGLPERGIVIRLSTGELDTRTQLTSTGDYHHVEEVWAVLYKWNGNESADPTTDPNNHGNYYFESATRLNLEDGSPWNPYDERNDTPPERGDYNSEDDYKEALDAYNNKWGGEYGNGKVQGREFVLPESGAMQAGTYRVLCIGFDEASKTCYDLQNQDGSSLTLSGTLANAYAKLSSNKEFGGELFAGWQEFDFEPDNINIVEVELKRRVAGVLCYVNDIPTTITDGTSTYTINTIRLCLNTQANDAIHLCRLDDRTKDFGTSDRSIFTEDKTILAEYTIPDDIIAAHQGGVGQGKEIFEGNLGQTFEDVQIKKGSVLLGAYLIPIKHVEGKATLSVELLDANGTVAKTFNAVRSDDPDGELTDESGATIDSQNTTSYDILPNYIYHIGNKDDDTDEPMSLLGQELLVEAKEWEDETIPVEFPNVPIYNTMRLVYPTNPGDIENTEWVGYGDDYVFDCIGVDNIYKPDGYYWDDNYDKLLFLEVDVSVLKEGWSLHIGAPGEDGQMLRFFDDNEYKTDVSRDGQQKEYIPLLMTSYAENDLNKKRRSVTIILTSDGAGKPVNLTVKQDNALIVSMKYGNDDYGVRGFSRRDWHDGETLPWGYSALSDIPSQIYNYANYSECWCEGDKLYSAAKDKNYGNKFSGSAIYKCAKGFLTLDANGQRDISGHWYLPARRELHSFLKAYPEEAGSTKYWTSTAYVSGKTYCNYVEDIDTGELYDDVIGDTDNIYKPIDRDKSDYTMRAACMIEAPIYD